MEKSKIEVPLIEKLKSIPEVFGIRVSEQAHYETLMHEGSKEIRRYSPVVVAKTVVSARDYEQAVEEGFHRLADYIFGQGKDGEAISMTAPVLQEISGEGEWTLSFILPAEISFADAPHPNNPQVFLAELPSRTWAVVRYSGSNSIELIDEKTQELITWLIDTGNKGDVTQLRVAGYDGPHVIPFLRRNEIQIPILSKHQRT